MSRMLRSIVLVLFMVAMLAGLGVWYRGSSGAEEPTFRTQPIRRGDVVATISATGTIQPEEVINVGAQVAGRIVSFGKDKSGNPIDNNSEVEEGDVLALIDPVLYDSEVEQADAQLKQAQAGVARAEADLVQIEAKYRQAQRDWDRAQKLGPSDALAQVEYDTYQSNFEAAKANIGVGQASIAQAKATLAQAEASMKRARQNLSYCTIKAPVKGVIIARRVNIGQTVVSSLSAPSLFLMAKDLTRVRIWTAVNEADIGSIRAGQDVSFTVDKYRERTFHGKVHKVRLEATMTQNVVTYIVEIETDNSDRALIPYLTANVSFHVAKREDVLKVPNAALRWMPAAEYVAPDVRPPQRTVTTAPAEEGQERPGTLWVLDGKHVRPIECLAGATDGAFTEVSGAQMQEGMEVVTGEQTSSTAGPGAGGSTSNNPFAPQFPRGGRRGGSR